MKKIFLPVILLLLSGQVFSQQLGDVLKKSAAAGAQQGAEVSTERTADKLADKALNKLFGGGKKNKKNNTDNAAPTDKTQQTASNAGTSNAQTASSSDANSSNSLKSYTKYDFIPGEKILGVEDYSKDSVGDFPARWTTNASGEVMTVDGHEGHWLNVSKEGYYVPLFIKSLPDNFTLEYDVLFIPLAQRQGANTASLGSQIITAADNKKVFDLVTDKAYFEIDPYGNTIDIASYTKTGEKILSNSVTIQGIERVKSFFYHVAVWRQKTRLRVYLNETKVIDVPTLLGDDINYNMFRFTTSLNNDGSTWLISNFKIASGLPDTRNKLLTEGKFSTTGILFDVNKATIKPTSYATLKDIASVMKDNGGLRIKIIGHTDSDGDNNTNIELSKQRAMSVKTALVNEFGIDESRMDTDGKGSSQPVATNNTSEGKAQNRRVEFIKL